MLNLNHLYSFYVCAEQLNVSKAAKILEISQPSLSMQIKKLEEVLGEALFLRNGKSISLTAKGRELLRSASIYSELNAQVNKCMDKSPDQSLLPILRILVTDQIERPFVAEVVSKLAKKGSGRMAILSSTTEDAFNKTESHETDILLSHEKVASSWNYIKIDFPVYFVTSSVIPKTPTFDHPTNIHKIIDYFGEDLIVPAPTLKMGKEFAAFQKKNRLYRNVILESDIVSCLVRFVANGKGCSFLPLPYIKSSLYQNRLHMVGPREGFWKHTVYIYANIPKLELENHALVKTIRNYGTI